MPHKENTCRENRENLEPTTPRFQSPDVPTQLTFSSSTTSAILGSGESSSNYTASQSSIGTPTDCELSAKRKFRNQRKRRVKRRILEGSSREIRTFIHQIDATRSSEVDTEETDTQVSSQCSADDYLETETSFEPEPEFDLPTGEESEVTSNDYDEDDLDDSDGTDVAERSFQFSSNPLTCNSKVTVHNASMCLFADAARHCLPDEALFDLLKWQKIIHPHENVPTPNLIKSETKKLTDLYVKDTEKNASGEVIFLNFAEKLKEKVEKYINEIIDYANPETETDLKLTSLFDDGTINVKLILNIDGVEVRKSSDCSAYPVWVALADLPPKLRASLDNIFLCSLWYGKGKVFWDPIFEHYRSELAKPQNICYKGRLYEISFTTIFLVVDLVCRHDVLNMKKFNGYYGCGLCTMRGFQRIPGTHSYPNSKSFSMRNPAEHHILVMQAESGSVEERKSRKEKDPEVDTLGVKGRSKLFDIIPNLPLTCPVDTMHQCLKGVASDVIKCFAEQLSLTELSAIDNATCQVVLPNEFKRSISSLSSIDHFKANELKTFLLYFSPLLFQKFSESSAAHDANMQNLNYLVFSLRSLYENTSNANLCGHLLEAFCYNMSFRYPLKKFDSINFHLLRHLAWQCKTFGPLWTTSATMFENANNHLIKTLTGSVNTCSLIVSRYIRNRQLESFEVKDDHLKAYIENLWRRPTGITEDLCLERNNFYYETQKKFPEARLFCRYRGRFYLDSQNYTRSNANSFVAIDVNGETIVGQILLFKEQDSELQCFVQLYEIVEKFVVDLRSTEFARNSDSFEPLAYRVAKSTDVQAFKLDAIKNKLIKFAFLGDLYFISVLKHFEHD